MKLYGADDFKAVFDDAKLVYFAGRPGTGKTLFGVALALWLLEIGRVDAVIANVPIAFATPAQDAPLERVALVIDELGWFFDARQFGANDANRFRKTILGFPRKVQSYTIVCSKLVVDASFRALTVQRTFSLFGWWRYTYAESEGGLDGLGNFWAHDFHKLFRADLLPPGSQNYHEGRFLYSQYYATGYIPNGVQYLADWCVRAVAASQDSAEYDSNCLWSLEDAENELASVADIPFTPSPIIGLTAADVSGSSLGLVESSSLPVAEREDRNYLPHGRSEAERRGARKLLGGGSAGSRRPDYSDRD